MIRVRCATKGFRTRELILQSPPCAGPGKISRARKSPAGQLFLQRWNVELFFSRPENHPQNGTPTLPKPDHGAKGTLLMHLLIGYNLIRAVMLQQSARTAMTSPLGTLELQRQRVDAALRQYGTAISQSQNKSQSGAIGEGTPARAGQPIWSLIAPVAKNRAPSSAACQALLLLTKPRHQFAEIPHRGKYRAAAARH